MNDTSERQPGLEDLESREAEAIARLVRWMRFVAVFLVILPLTGVALTAVGGLLMWERFELVVGGLAAVAFGWALLSAGALAWQGVQLHGAASQLELFAMDDEPDLDLVRRALFKLRRFFAMDIAVALAGLLPVIAVVAWVGYEWVRRLTEVSS